MEDEFEITEGEAIANPFMKMKLSYDSAVTDAQYNESEDRFWKWYEDNRLSGSKTDIDVCKYAFFEGERQANNNAKEIISGLLDFIKSGCEGSRHAVYVAERFLEEKLQ